MTSEKERRMKQHIANIQTREPFPNMTSRHIRMMVTWTIEHVVELINKYEQELMQHQAYQPDQIYATKWQPETRGKRIVELQKYLQEYGEMYSIMREIKERLDTDEAEKFGREMADYMRSQK